MALASWTCGEGAGGGGGDGGGDRQTSGRRVCVLERAGGCVCAKAARPGCLHPTPPSHLVAGQQRSLGGSLAQATARRTASRDALGAEGPTGEECAGGQSRRRVLRAPMRVRPLPLLPLSPLPPRPAPPCPALLSPCTPPPAPRLTHLANAPVASGAAQTRGFSAVSRAQKAGSLDAGGGGGPASTVSTRKGLGSRASASSWMRAGPAGAGCWAAAAPRTTSSATADLQTVEGGRRRGQARRSRQQTHFSPAPNRCG